MQFQFIVVKPITSDYSGLQHAQVQTSQQAKHNNITIALFTVYFSHLHYNIIERGCEAISGKKLIVQNCPKLPHIHDQKHCNVNEKR